MLYYFLKRCALGAVIVVIAVVLLYVMIHMVPGDPANTMLGPRASPEIKAALHKSLGLDQPLIVQIGRFLVNTATGNLGIDVFSRRPVATMVFEQLPNTLILIVVSLGWAVLVGVPLGCFSALRRNSFVDKFLGLLSVGTIAIPSFVVAIYALLVFAVYLGWLPAIGLGRDDDLWDRIRHLILPALAVGLGWVGYVARMIRSSMLEVLGENHIRTARAFGLPQSMITYRYALRLAILPTIAVLGVGLGSLLSNAVFAEIVFARPGIGKLIYDSVVSRNYPVVMGSVLMTTILYVLATTVADVIAAWLDPRIRQSL